MKKRFFTFIMLALFGLLSACGAPAESSPAPAEASTETPAPETPAPETPAPETPVPETPAPVEEWELAENCGYDPVTGELIDKMVWRYGEDGLACLRVDFHNDGYDYPKYPLDEITHHEQYPLEEIVGEDIWHFITQWGHEFDADGKVKSSHTTQYINATNGFFVEWYHENFAWHEDGFSATKSGYTESGLLRDEEVVFPYYLDDVNYSRTDYSPADEYEANLRIRTVLVDTEEQLIRKDYSPGIDESYFYVWTKEGAKHYRVPGDTMEYGEEHLVETDVRECDEQGRIMALDCRDANGKPLHRFEYNAEEEIVKATYYDANGQPRSITEYGSNGLDQVTTRYAQGAITEIFEMIYEEDGHSYTRRIYDGDHTLTDLRTYLYRPLSELTVTGLDSICEHEMPKG
ncbi:MAG: hypothetical protein IJE22_02785 [Oscillibacter sp.]|nr:hypothetical protein [Oscillibacter sp.]